MTARERMLAGGLFDRPRPGRGAGRAPARAAVARVQTRPARPARSSAPAASSGGTFLPTKRSPATLLGRSTAENDSSPGVRARPPQPALRPPAVLPIRPEVRERVG